MPTLGSALAHQQARLAEHCDMLADHTSGNAYLGADFFCCG